MSLTRRTTLQEEIALYAKELFKTLDEAREAREAQLTEEIVLYAVTLMESIDMTNVTLKDIKFEVMRKYPGVSAETFQRAFNAIS